jgi:hypothetical protein
MAPLDAKKRRFFPAAMRTALWRAPRSNLNAA